MVAHGLRFLSGLAVKFTFPINLFLPNFSCFASFGLRLPSSGSPVRRGGSVHRLVLGRGEKS